MNMNQQQRTMNIKIGSINCRTIMNIYKPSDTDNFIRTLRRKKFNLLLCQETNIKSHSFTTTIESLKYKFQYHQTIWTEYCGIINNNKALNLETIKTSDDGRMIIAKVTIVDNFMPPFLF
jgi:hypothetical protein